MDKKWLIKTLILNSLWIAWIVLSVVFGYLIARYCYPENILLFIPFSLIFLAGGGGIALIAYKLVSRKRRSAKTEERPADNSATADVQTVDSAVRNGDDCDGTADDHGI